MSIAKHHNEWLSLIDISGPFLSLKVLTDRFPQGLPAVTADLRSDLRAAYEEWADNQRGLQQDPAIHQAWFDFVFTDLLGYPARLFRPCPADDCPAEWQATLAERQITLRPDFVLRHPNEAQPRLLVMTLPSHQGLEKRSKEAYTAVNDLSPATQMLELLRATGVPLGLATNGGEWLLVYTVPGEAASYATWKTELWLDEPLTLHAFYALLSLGRFFGVPDDETLPALLAASKDNQHDVTDQLGLQTRHAVEILVQAIAKADMDRQGRLLAAIDERALYEAALTVMMRLVFLLSAEEQGLLLLGDPIYDQNYAISTLRAQLREAADQVGEEVIQRRTDAWARLLATFRAVYGGVWHPQLGLPAYGGSLFDPERFPFLEGRTAEQPDGPVNPLPIDNRTVLHLLQALQQLELRAGGVTTLRTLSFRALDVEQIGHVYEGLLDHQAVRATEVVLGLEGAAGLEPEIPLATLATEAAKGEAALLDFLAAATKRSKPALARALAGELSDWRHGRFLTACGGDEQLLERLLPFAGLVRDDTRQEPLVILPGEVYVTAGLTRRQTGSHYTPRSLTEPIVQHTLEPLVYVGPAEGLPREQWRLRPPAELLELKVCDMAMGSGAFLVQACRYLAERLLEAWEAEETIEEVASSDATRRGATRRASEDARLLKWQNEEVASEEVASSDATRRGATRRASEDARLLKWQNEEVASEEVASSDATRRGATRRASEDARLLNERLLGLEPTPNRPFAGPFAAQNLDELYTLAKRLVAERCLYGVDKNPLAVEMAKLSLWLVTLSKNKPFTFVNHALRHGDSLIGAEEDGYNRWWHSLKGTVGPLYAEETEKALHEARRLRRELQTMQVLDVQDAQRKADLLAAAEAATATIRRACDLLVGVQLLGLSQTEQETWRQKLLIEHVGSAEMDSPEAKQSLTAARQHDAFHWFVEFPEVFAQGGFSAFIGNPPFLGGTRISTVYGDSYLSALKSKFPAMFSRADLCSLFFLNAFEKINKFATFGLIATNTIAQGDTREAGLLNIMQRGGKIYRGTTSIVWPGQASVVVSILHVIRGEYHGELTLDNKPVDQITSFLDDAPTMGEPHVINRNSGIMFNGSKLDGIGFVLNKEEALALISKDENNKKVIYPFLSGQDLNSNPDQYPTRWVINFFEMTLEEASKFPACLQIVRERVYPQRQKHKEKNTRENWWRFQRTRQDLYESISSLNEVLVIAGATKYVAFVLVPNQWVYNKNTFVLVEEGKELFPILQSSFHDCWAWKNSSTLGTTTLNYAPSKCFDTFPFPESGINIIGETYHEHRKKVMLNRQEGLTATYNRFHDPAETAQDIAHLRRLHLEMDNAVAAAYGWSDLALDHGFHETAQGVRYTISEAARREVLTRLLQLNHQRYAEEQAQGSEGAGEQGRKKKAVKGRAKKDDGQLSLL